MKYTVTRSVVDVIGYIWQPGVGQCAMTYELTRSDVDNARDLPTRGRKITRESLECWLDCHAGDFSEVTDFRASVEVDGETVEIEWADEESELVFNDCMYGEEE